MHCNEAKYQTIRDPGIEKAGPETLLAGAEGREA